ncbi:MAG: MarR family winged helix-turn-helix transcriptional regulator [Rhodospirillales bacterium]
MISEPAHRGKTVKPPVNPLFLRESELRQSMELLFFGYRDFTGDADRILAGYGFGRAHHRVIYFVGANPGVTVGQLLEILRITKQSLSRVLGVLIEQGFVRQDSDAEDRRRRRLTLTEKGRGLERELTAVQTRRIARACREAGADAVAGFRAVMRGIIDEKDRSRIADDPAPETRSGGPH